MRMPARVFAFVAGVVVMTGCYTLRPALGTTPEVGSLVAFDLNDAGRVALGGSMGPEIAQVEGRLMERDNGEYLLAVSSVRLLRGGEQVWSGEQVRLKPEYVGTAYEKKFSMGRSIALGAIGVGGFAGFLVSRSLLGGGRSSGDQPGDTANTRLGRP